MKRTSELLSYEIAATTAQSSRGKRNEQSLAPGLHIVSTPIGNARDITLRALDILQNCDLIAAEDTRVISKLLAIYGLKRSLTSYNDHNAARERPRLIERLKAGASVALVSDAGTPMVSDPGCKLVREALAAGIHVHAVPGPSAVLAALVVSGSPTDRFLFAGFLSSKVGERRRALGELRHVAATLIFYESAQRLAESLADMHLTLGDRYAVTARELTKFHEEVRRGPLTSLLEEYKGQPIPKGEITILLAPPAHMPPDFAKTETLLKNLLLHMPLSAAVDIASETFAFPKRELYKRALELKERAVEA